VGAGPDAGGTGVGWRTILPAVSMRDHPARPELSRLTGTPQEHRFPPEGALMPARGVSLVCEGRGAPAGHPGGLGTRRHTERNGGKDRHDRG